MVTLQSKNPDAPKQLEVDIYLAATGRSPKVPRGLGGLGLEACGVEIAKSGHIVVNAQLESAAEGVFAAGDCIKGPSLASTGVEQAQRAVANAFGGGKGLSGVDNFPIGVWTIPEVSYYGLTKAQAQAKGFDAEEGVASYDSCLRGRVFSPDGMLKLVFDKHTHIIIGVHIIGTDACEMVHYGMDLVARKATIFDVINTLFTAVTFHELFKEAALDANSRLEFGIQWQEVLKRLSSETPARVLLTSGVLENKFNEIDTNGDGSIDETELWAVFKGLGIDIPQAIVSNLVNLVDDDGNGTVEWEEFERVYQVIADIEERQGKC